MPFIRQCGLSDVSFESVLLKTLHDNELLVFSGFKLLHVGLCLLDCESQPFSVVAGQGPETGGVGVLMFHGVCLHMQEAWLRGGHVHSKCQGPHFGPPPRPINLLPSCATLPAPCRSACKSSGCLLS